MHFGKLIFLFFVTALLIAVTHYRALGQTSPHSIAAPNPDLVAFEVTDQQVRGFQKAMLFDKYGIVTSNEEKETLDGFAKELQSDPRALGYIIVFGKKGRPASEASKRAIKAKNYLVNYNRTSNKILMVTSCFRASVQYELWIVPTGAKRPATCSGPAK